MSLVVVVREQCLLLRFLFFLILAKGRNALVTHHSHPDFRSRRVVTTDKGERRADGRGVRSFLPEWKEEVSATFPKNFYPKTTSLVPRLYATYGLHLCID